MLLDIVKKWLSEEAFDKDRTLALVGEEDVSLANAIRTEMSRLVGKASGSSKRELTIQNALAGGPFMVWGSWKRRNA